VNSGLFRSLWASPILRTIVIKCSVISGAVGQTESGEIISHCLNNFVANFSLKLAINANDTGKPTSLQISVVNSVLYIIYIMLRK
jgi:hypothetical protein